MQFVREQSKFNVVLDKRALEEMALAPDVPVTIKAVDIPLQSALNLLLRDFGLVWTVRDNVVEITSQEAVDQRLSTRVYDVSDLTSNAVGLRELIMAVLDPESWNEVGGAGSLVADRCRARSRWSSLRANQFIGVWPSS